MAPSALEGIVMHLMIAAIGKRKDPAVEELIERYRSRCPWKIELSLWEAKKNLQGEALQREESRLLLSATEVAACRIALDETGQMLSSTAFAKRLQQHQYQQQLPIALLIGGADGHHPQTLAACQWRLSLGAMVWPHMLVRVMVMEQLYRAWAILQQHPYHRE